MYGRGGDLYAIAVDGSRRVRLTRNGVFRTEPVLSNDGRRVAYIRRNYTELWVGTTDGRPGTRVVSEQHGVDRPAWTFDDRTLVFPRYFVGNQHGATCGALFVVGRDGRGLRRVTDPGGHSHLNPSVSPDGRVAFLDWNACEGGTAEYVVDVVDMSGRPTGDLAKLPRAAYGDPAWSPDGRTVALAANRLQLARRDGSGARPITPRYLGVSRPDWAPGGGWIAFSGGRDNGPGGLYVIRPDGTGLRRLAPGGDTTAAGWLRRLPRR